MSEIIKKRLEKSKGKDIKIFLHNNFRYFGKLKDFDEDYIEIFDYKSNSYKIIEIIEIKELEVKEVENDN